MLVFATEDASSFLADVIRDKLSDLVRICNGEVGYWPNLGYGKFGRKIVKDNLPTFEVADSFSAAEFT